MGKKTFLPWKILKVQSHEALKGQMRPLPLGLTLLDPKPHPQRTQGHSQSPGSMLTRPIHSRISKRIQLPWFIKEWISLGHLLTNICYSSIGKQYACTLWKRYTWSLLPARIKEAASVNGKDTYVQNLPSCFICILFTTPERLVTMPIKFCSHWSVTYVLEIGMRRKVGYVSKNLH